MICRPSRSRWVIRPVSARNCWRASWPSPTSAPLAKFIIFGDARVLDMGAKVAGTNPDVARAKSDTALPAGEGRPILVDLANCDLERRERRQGDARGRQFRDREFPPRAAAWPQAGGADAVFFTPFNKAAMRFAYPDYDDEIRFVRDVIGVDGAGERIQHSRRSVECARDLAYPAVAKSRATSREERILRALTLADASCARPASTIRASPSPASIRMPATAAISAARRSTSSSRRSPRPRPRASPSRARSRPTPSSCARRTATSTPC